MSYLSSSHDWFKEKENISTLSRWNVFDEFAFIPLVKWVKWRITKAAAIPLGSLYGVVELFVGRSPSNYLLIGFSLICFAIYYAITLDEVLEQLWVQGQIIN